MEKKTIWHSQGTDIHDSVKSGAAWLNLRGLLGLGGGARSAECRSGEGMCPERGFGKSCYRKFSQFSLLNNKKETCQNKHEYKKISNTYLRWLYSNFSLG